MLEEYLHAQHPQNCQKSGEDHSADQGVWNIMYSTQLTCNYSPLRRGGRWRWRTSSLG